MSINTYTFLCPGLFLVLAGCTQSPAASSARDAAFSDSLKPAAPADIWQRSPEVTREGRYTLVSVKSADAQREPLNQLIDITMPGSLVNSVGDGFRYLLFQSGYSLCGRYGADFSELLNRPLPAVQRHLGPVRLSEALQVVAGPAWRMTVDEVNREVCFVMRDAYLAQARPASSPVTAAPAVAPVVSASAAGASSAGVQTRQSETLPLPAVPVLTASGTGGKGTVKTAPVSTPFSTAAMNQMATTGGRAAVSPSLTPATTDNKSSSAAVAASATSQATPSPAVAATGRNPFSGKDLTGKTTATPVVSTASPSPVAPTASSPAPALSTPVPKLIGTPVKALP
ncbi:hypothetical protein CC707_25330, partial [Salmonella enterica subsp. enterica serovar Panama]|nr:hypothetical protein [Salmonella enterica subsp. enterica serovar Panama]